MKIKDLFNIEYPKTLIYSNTVPDKNGINFVSSQGKDNSVVGTVKSRYNQVANFTYLDTQVNKAISDDAPAVYFKTVMEQFGTGNAEIGNIMDKASLDVNLAENALPPETINMTVDDYESFLSQRRHLMARMIETYYKSL